MKTKRRKSNNPYYGQTKKGLIEMTAIVEEEQVNEEKKENAEEKVNEEEEMVEIGTPSMENWETMIDPDSGNAYFYNNETSESQWVSDIEEEEEMVKTDAPSMENWETMIDPDSGNAYFYNNETGESEWVSDVNDTSSFTSELSTAKCNPMLEVDEGNGADEDEDSAWIRAFDDTHEAWYWYNSVTKETRWE